VEKARSLQKDDPIKAKGTRNKKINILGQSLNNTLRKVYDDSYSNDEDFED
jgi:hypothetical protein